MIRSYYVAVAVVATLMMIGTASAQFGQGNLTNNLFSQYATQNGSVTAGMYPAPHPAPYMGAHSYYTYQPLMPHEMMYQHSRNYFNYYNTGGYYDGVNSGQNALTKTSVRWQSGANHMGNLPFSSVFSNATWNLHNRRYCIDGNCGGGGAGLGGGQLRGRLRGHFGSKCAGGNCGGEVISGGCESGNCSAGY